MSRKLDDNELNAAMAALSQWKLEQGELVHISTFGDFKQAMTFVNHIAELAEAAGHHPDIDIRYNRVRLALVTHDAGGITQNDISLAKEITKELTK